ncbi:hypothetical protein CsSME_00048750 [Camellia sinensis var. sinensis]
MSVTCQWVPSGFLFYLQRASARGSVISFVVHLSDGGAGAVVI